MPTPSKPVPATLSPLRRAVLSAALLLGVAGCVGLAQPSGMSSVVFFTSFSADLDAAAQAVVRDAVAFAKAAPAKPVIVSGYADSAGSPAANQTLSRLRAQVVSDALVQGGVDRARISLRPKGPQGGDPGVESRRVEINIPN